MSRSKHRTLYAGLVCCVAGACGTAAYGKVTPMTADHWSADGKTGIVWQVARDERLPHEDHLEMSGRKVSLIVRYGTSAERNLVLSREVIWPMLRTSKDDVRGYTRRTYADEVSPAIRVDGTVWTPGPVERISFDGVLTIVHAPVAGVAAVRCLFPSMSTTRAFETWELRNVGSGTRTVDVAPMEKRDSGSGIYGTYELSAYLDPVPAGAIQLLPGKTARLTVVYAARISGTRASTASVAYEERARRAFLKKVGGLLRLETPDDVLNREFGLCRIRAAESVFATKMGLVHSPGGGRYYGGIWANDQAEYSGPFFAFLGEPTSTSAALNAYRIYARGINPEFRYLPSSFEVEGDVQYHAGGDRGDAAMVAYGASRFALAHGDRTVARELWPLIQWCLDYCQRKTSSLGVVESDTDELEGRFPTGKANLSTSTLAYGALVSAADLASELGESTLAETYRRRATDLRTAIDAYFGDTVEGFDTYRYYDGNTVLRAWICLPLVMGITDRAPGTIRALFSPRLWTDDGLATQAGDTVFWDRSTLYALRGVFFAGQTETALSFLQRYTRRRLLGDHVPYPVEAYPEGGQAHLSAESALYCRVFTEGLFGITPTGFRSFRCLPHMPSGWNYMALRNVMAFGGPFDLKVERVGNRVRLTVSRRGKPSIVLTKAPSQAFDVRLSW